MHLDLEFEQCMCYLLFCLRQQKCLGLFLDNTETGSLQFQSLWLSLGGMSWGLQFILISEALGHSYNKSCSHTTAPEVQGSVNNSISISITFTMKPLWVIHSVATSTRRRLTWHTACVLNMLATYFSKHKTRWKRVNRTGTVAFLTPRRLLCSLTSPDKPKLISVPTCKKQPKQFHHLALNEKNVLLMFPLNLYPLTV